jgi:hypothetical protein
MGVGGGGTGFWSAGGGGRGRGMGWDGMTGRVSISPGGYWIPHVEVFAALIAVAPSLIRRVSEVRVKLCSLVVCVVRKGTKVKLQTVCVSKQTTRFERSGERTCFWGAAAAKKSSVDKETVKHIGTVVVVVFTLFRSSTRTRTRVVPSTSINRRHHRPSSINYPPHSHSLPPPEPPHPQPNGSPHSHSQKKGILRIVLPFQSM